MNCSINMVGKNRKKISQQQIAKELGISQSLVSIILNGRKEGISPNTYNRVWDYALKQGYTPKGMKVGKLKEPNQKNISAVGYFLRSPLKLATKSNFFSHLTQGLHDQLSENQCNTIFLGSEDDFENNELNKLTWQEDFFQGIVIMGEVKPSFLNAVRALGKPIAYMCARAPGLCHSVNSNEFQAAEQLVKHLTELGHKHFAFLGAQCARTRQSERLEATKTALQAKGIDLTEEDCFEFKNAERKEGFEIAEILLKRKNHEMPTAWICVNGLLARGVISRLQIEGLEAGEEISVAAFDNTRICTEEAPTITSAASLPEELGKEAARLLLNTENIGSKNLSDIVLPSVLKIRKSTGPLKKS